MDGEAGLYGHPGTLSKWLIRCILDHVVIIFSILSFQNDDPGLSFVSMGVIPDFKRCVSTPPIAFRLALTGDQNRSGQGSRHHIRDHHVGFSVPRMQLMLPNKMFIMIIIHSLIYLITIDYLHQVLSIVGLWNEMIDNLREET